MGRIAVKEAETPPLLPKIMNKTIDNDESLTFLTGARIDENRRYGSIDETAFDN